MPEVDRKRLVVEIGDRRADRTIADVLGVGRRKARDLIEAGAVRVDGHRVRCSDRVAAGAEISLAAESAEHDSSRDVTAEPRIVWTDGRIVAVDKPRGFHSVRGAGKPSIADFLADSFPGIDRIGDGGRDCGLVHRLDRDTSGVLLATTDATLHSRLRSAFSLAAVCKTYLAIVEGVVSHAVEIDAPLVQQSTGVRPARLDEPGRPATTRIDPLEYGADWTLVRCSMRTGVTHQIRAHMAHAGHPILGDDKYASSTSSVRAGAGDGQRLHAFSVRVRDEFEIAVPPPREFLATLARLRCGSARCA
jgi:23S rRNA pseudouridine1911/1915/1917 synthase